jgi:hypothetical protein
MGAVRTSETSVDNHITRQYIPEDNSEHQTRRRENLKSHRIFKVCSASIDWFDFEGMRDYVSELLPLTDTVHPPDDTEKDNGIILTREPKNSERNLSQCHFVHHKSHMD